MAVPYEELTNFRR